MSYSNSGDLKLSQVQQYFLQLMLQKSVIDQCNFKHIFCSVLDRFQVEYHEDRLRETYVRFLRDINQVIRHFNLEIKTGTCELTGLSYFCMIQQTDKSFAKLSSLYSPIELKIFRKILELVIESDSGSVDFNFLVDEIKYYYDELVQQAQEQDGTIKVPTLRDIRSAIEKFLQNYWLTEIINEPSKITLHGRALLELGPYIKQVFEPELLHHCYLCKLLVLNFFECSECSIRMHRPCAKKFYKETLKCPSCNQTVSETRLNSMLESMSSVKNMLLTQRSN